MLFVTSPRQVVTLNACDLSSAEGSQLLLVKTKQVELVQLCIPRGGVIPRYEAQGELILHCLEGRVSILAAGEEHDLQSRHLLYLLIGDPFSIRAIEDASVLVTIVAAAKGARVQLIGE
jgi:quercetin dioxygenase-like cupin family protein